jgi:hypothetical protein
MDGIYLEDGSSRGRYDEKNTYKEIDSKGIFSLA